MNQARKVYEARHGVVPWPEIHVLECLPHRPVVVDHGIWPQPKTQQLQVLDCMHIMWSVVELDVGCNMFCWKKQL